SDTLLIDRSTGTGIFPLPTVRGPRGGDRGRRGRPCVMNPSSAADLIAALQEHQLLDPALLEEAQREMIHEDTGPLELAAQLVERQWLTEYQVERLLQGRGKELVVGSYRLLEPIGEGGMGQVFKALHQRLNRVVALKLIRPECLSQDS